MTNEQIWNCNAPIADLLNVVVPDWIDQDISSSTIASICQGGCSSGAYMPAVTYYVASRVMADHGDHMLQYILDVMGELPAPGNDISWSGIACLYLSCAVELWAGDIYNQLAADDFRGGAQ